VWILDKIFDEIDKNTIVPAKTDSASILFAERLEK